ncbi:putative small secreted protein [Roseovarius sp. MBR-78]|jgi:predicted small secreted protein
MKYVIVALVALAGLAGCETVEGAGQDIQKAGKAIQKTAN